MGNGPTYFERGKGLKMMGWENVCPCGDEIGPYTMLSTWSSHIFWVRSFSQACRSKKSSDFRNHEKGCEPFWGKMWYSSHALSGCGDVILAHRSGNLTSPDYPKPYKKGESCTWLLAAGQEETLTLHFNDFELHSPNGSKCPDYLEVRDGQLGMMNRYPAAIPVVRLTFYGGWCNVLIIPDS